MRDGRFGIRLGETRTLGRVGCLDEGGGRPATVLVISTSASGPGEALWRIGFGQARSGGLPDSRVKRARAVPERVESRRPSAGVAVRVGKG